MKYVYIRVSTIEQNTDRQLSAMEKYNIPKENYYIEKISGKNTNRPELQKLLATVKPGDIIHIHDFSRLSRSTSDLLRIVEQLNDMGVTLISNKENLDTSTPTGKLMLTMIGAINEFERTNMLERQSEGIKESLKRGAFDKKKKDTEKIKALKAKVDAGNMTASAAAEQLGITRATWYAWTKQICA